MKAAFRMFSGHRRNFENVNIQYIRHTISSNVCLHVQIDVLSSSLHHRLRLRRRSHRQNRRPVEESVLVESVLVSPKRNVLVY